MVSEDFNETNEVRFTMRMSSDLYERLKQRANRLKRSIAKEIEYIVEQKITADEKEINNQFLGLVAALMKEGKKPEDLKHIDINESSSPLVKEEYQKLLDLLNGNLI